MRLALLSSLQLQIRKQCSICVTCKSSAAAPGTCLPPTNPCQTAARSLVKIRGTPCPSDQPCVPSTFVQVQPLMLKCIEKVGRRRVNLQKKKGMKFGRDSPGKNYRVRDFDGQTSGPPGLDAVPLAPKAPAGPRRWARLLRPCPP